MRIEQQTQRQNQELRPSAPAERVSIVLKTVEPQQVTKCHLCGNAGSRAAVDYVIEGTDHDVCHRCAEQHDDILASMAPDVFMRAESRRERKKTDAATWRAVLELHKQGCHGAVHALEGQVTTEQGGPRNMPDDVKEEFVRLGISNWDDAQRALSWGQYNAPF